MTGVSVIQMFIQALGFTGLFILKPLSPFGALLAHLLPQTLFMTTGWWLKCQTSHPNHHPQKEHRPISAVYFLLFRFVLQGGYSALFGDRDSDRRLASKKLATDPGMALKF